MTISMSILEQPDIQKQLTAEVFAKIHGVMERLTSLVETAFESGVMVIIPIEDQSGTLLTE